MSTTAAQDASSAHAHHRVSTTSTIMNGAHEPTTTPTSPGRASAAKSPRPSKSIIAPVPVVQESPAETGETVWGSNFWVTLVDPQTQTSFFACPATGQVSWDPPVGNFVLPPSSEGEWWELTDESRGLPYYYQTKTGETVWERPDGFVIPLGILQNTALGRRLSTNFISHTQSRNSTASVVIVTPDQPIRHPKTSFRSDHDTQPHNRTSQLSVRSTASGTNLAQSNRLHAAASSSASTSSPPPAHRQRSSSADPHPHPNGRFYQTQTHLPPIPDVTDRSTPPSPVSRKSRPSTPDHPSPKIAPIDSPNGKVPGSPSPRHQPAPAPNQAESSFSSSTRGRTKSSPYASPQQQQQLQQQSFGAAVELLTGSEKLSISDTSHASHAPSPKPGANLNGVNGVRPSTANNNTNNGWPPPTGRSIPTTPIKERKEPPPSPRRPPPSAPTSFWRNASGSGVVGREISEPTLNHEATLNMSPVKNRSNGRPIPVYASQQQQHQQRKISTATLSSGTHPILPQDLAMDIQQFSESEYAKQYFSTHRTGFIFRRRVPVAQMMTWQKTPLASPLLALNRSLGKEAVKIFKVIQRIMGDRERDRSVGVRLAGDNPNYVSTVPPVHNGSTTSLPNSHVSVLEEERWLLAEGLAHGELRDEIYCQLMKQLSGNPNPESVFRGMQLFCVLLVTFPPSKNFETYLESYMHQKTTQHQGRVDVMAKYCLRRLAFITKKGPRGKPPSIAEIETASDAAFNPSTFGESLDTSIRLQERNYPQQKVPIILPFLADGILALGGTKAEGIFRVPGDGDSVSELKLRIDRGYYTLDGVDDPYVLASAMKLWLRELCDPLVPEEMYNECIGCAGDPGACVRLVERLPTINRRVVLFVVSFLQLFLEERIQVVTKMTPANLALVMAPNLLRCSSESMAVVFTNAQFEQLFVFNLLLHLKCNQVDPGYSPQHGLGAVPSAPTPRTSKTRTRRVNH